MPPSTPFPSEEPLSAPLSIHLQKEELSHLSPPGVSFDPSWALKAFPGSGMNKWFNRSQWCTAVEIAGVDICLLLVTPGRKDNMSLELWGSSVNARDESSEASMEGKSEQEKETRSSQCYLSPWIKPFPKLNFPLDFSVWGMWTFLIPDFFMCKIALLKITSSGYWEGWIRKSSTQPRGQSGYSINGTLLSFSSYLTNWWEL